MKVKTTYNYNYYESKVNESKTIDKKCKKYKKLKQQQRRDE